MEKRSALPPEALTLREIVRAEVYRGSGGSYGAPEELCINDLITTAGRNWLALRIGPAVNSPMGWMAVGSGNNAYTPLLSDTALLYEVKRKALSTNTAGITAANVYTAVMTLGGSADGVASLSIGEVGIFNHVGSGQGTMFQHVTFSPVVLANSDLLKISLETNVGSS